MQHVAVDMVRPEMFEGAGHRLGNLNGKAGCGIVGQPVVLPTLISELRLQKKIRARDQPGEISGSQSLTHSFFEVMPPLVSRVDGPKSHTDREFSQACSAIFLPGGAVQKVGNM